MDNSLNEIAEALRAIGAGQDRALPQDFVNQEEITIGFDHQPTQDELMKIMHAIMMQSNMGPMPGITQEPVYSEEYEDEIRSLER